MIAEKETQNEGLFDLCKKAAVVKQIKITSCQRLQKTVGGEITKKWEQISSTKYFNAKMYHFSKIPELSFSIHIQPCLACFGVII